MSNNLHKRFDKQVMQLIVYAKAASIEAKLDCIYPESFAIGLLTSGVNDITVSMVEMDVNLEKCLKDFKGELLKKQQQNNGDEVIGFTEIKLSKQFVDACKLADEIRQENRQAKINSVHMFLGMSRLSKSFVNVFEAEGVDFESLIKSLKEVKEPVASNGASDSKKKLSALEAFCTNLTQQAKDNEIDPIIARDKEIEYAITILCRRSKNNPIMLGEPGVGKTAIVEGIAQRIVSGTIPEKLKGCNLYSLNLATLVSGTKYRGEFEQRINALIEEVVSEDKCILFIDEIHMIVGAGSAIGGMDASNILKPFLSKGKLRCIGATTNMEFKKHFEKDGALTRRFQEIIVDEPTKDQMMQILHGVKVKLEEFHNCIISDEAIEAAINLSDRYLPNKHFPDKAIECLDTACAEYAWVKESDSNGIVLVMKNIAQVISKNCKIPIEVIMWDNNERIREIEKTIELRVIGQDSAVEKVCKTLRNAYSGIRNPNKPIGSFVFGGQTGTGKTYMAKEMAAAVFGSEKSYIRLDMSEFTEKHSGSKIIGSPPGYVGFSESDIFLDKIRRKPYSIIVLDEVEKAHPDVMRLFLQVMSDGSMTSAEGVNVNFKNTVLIMTGNFGMNEDKKAAIGFSDSEVESIVAAEQKRLSKYLEDRFGLEFVNRIDEIIPFIPLGKDVIRKIIGLRLDELNLRIQDRPSVVKYTEDVVDFLYESSLLDHGKNATLVERLISRQIEPVLSDALLEAGQDPYQITIRVNKGKLNYTKKKKL